MTTPTTPIRYDLCSRASRIGCTFILAVLASLVGLMVVEAPSASLSLLIYLPGLPIAVAVMVAMFKSAGQVLTTDAEEAVLTKHEAVLWRFKWADIRSLRVNGNLNWEFEDEAGKSYRLFVLNVPKPKHDEIRAYLPSTATLTSKSFELFRRRGQYPSYPLAILLLGCGLAALIWGLVGLSQAKRAAMEGDGDIVLARVGWQMIAVLFGVIGACAGALELRRRPDAPKPLARRRQTLRRYLAPSSGLALPSGESVWELLPGCENRHRDTGRLLLVACVFWGFMLSLVIVEVINNPRGWGLLAVYSPIILLHAAGIIAWVKEVDPKGYTIHLHGPDAWVESESQTYPATLKKLMGSRAVEFSLDGKRRALDPKYFGLRER